MTTAAEPLGPAYPFERAAQCPFDPPPEIGALRQTEAISRVSIWDGTRPWLVTRHQDVRTVLTDPRFSARPLPGWPPSSPGILAAVSTDPPPFPNLDGPEHTRLRTALISEFSARRIAGLRPMIDVTVEDLLTKMAARRQPVDLVEAFALPLPMITICSMLGVPTRDHDFFAEQTRSVFDVGSSLEHAQKAMGSLYAYLFELSIEREKRPADDVISRLSALVGDGRVTREEAATLGVTLLAAGHETTASQLGLGVLILLRNPEQAAKVRGGDEGVAKTATEELLRLLTIDQHGRRRVALEDLELGGVHIRAGDGIIAALDSANRDGDVYDHPDDLDVERAPNPHVAFGYGPHLCTGAALARAELRAAYPAILRRFPDLRLAIPFEQVKFRNAVVYGVDELPVTW